MSIEKALNSLARMQREAHKQVALQKLPPLEAALRYNSLKKKHILLKEQAPNITGDKQKKAHDKEIAQVYSEMRVAETELLNEQINRQIERLNNLLIETLSVDDYLDVELLKKEAFIPPFNPPVIEPTVQMYQIPAMTGLQKMMPGAKARHQKELENARERYIAHHNRYQDAKKKFDEQVEQLKIEAAGHNALIEQFKQNLEAGKPELVSQYFAMVLEASSYPDGFPQHGKLAYVPESKQLVVEYDLPSIDVIPPINLYKYTKSKDQISQSSRSDAQIKTLYTSVIAQVTLRTIHELYEADRAKLIETIVFNGYVTSLDRATGHDVRTCLVTVRTTRDVFMSFDLSRVEPSACLKKLNADVSKSPTELAPVRPVLEFNMVDPRFIEETDIISTLDQRTNLMELTPGEFESLITNLFQKMGLESRLTQASRDGGVDCVAYDPRPIFGGKVVIQAKRYKHTVGVSAVRDLFGTLQNEGASKGILVTTSGYGKAAYEFADGKPIELLSGSNLLFLLSEHAGVQAKIEPPEGWKDPLMDTPSLR